MTHSPSLSLQISPSQTPLSSPIIQCHIIHDAKALKEPQTGSLRIIVESDKVPYAEGVQVEILPLEAQNSMESIEDAESSSLLERRSKAYSEAQFLILQQVESMAHDAGRRLVKCGQILRRESAKNGAEESSRGPKLGIIRSLRTNVHMWNQLRRDLKDQLGEEHAQYLEECLNVLREYACVTPQITKVEWTQQHGSITATSHSSAYRTQAPPQPLNLVQFYKETQSILQILRTSFQHSHQLQFASNCFLLQYSIGSLSQQFVRYLAQQLRVNIFEITPYDIYSKLYHGEKGIANFSNQLFQIANESSPALIVIDQIDSFLPNDELEKDQFLIHEMLQILRNLKEWRNEKGNFRAVFLGMSSDLSQMDSFIRKKFDEELFIDIPTFQDRRRMVQHLLEKLLGSTSSESTLEEQVQELTERTHGYTMSDMQDMVHKVTQKAMRRFLFNDSSHTSDDTSQLALQFSDFVQYAKQHRPQSLKSNASALALPQMPKVTWEEIGGLHHIKEKLEELIIWPIKHADKFAELGLRPPSGLLLYGPPGVGKTLICKAVCTAAKTNFMSINIPDLIRAEIGESEKALAQVFRRAKLAAPCVIFFDEIQAMFGDRSSVSQSQQKLISQLLLELDTLEYQYTGNEKQNGQTVPAPSVLVIAATNVPHHIDPTVLRAKRLEYCIYVGPPDADARKSILEMQFGRKLKVSNDVWAAMDEWIERTEGFSGADVVNLCQQAGLNAIMRGEQRQIEKQDFDKALESVKPGASQEYLSFLENWRPTIGEEQRD